MSYTGINKSVFSKITSQEVELSKMDVELGLAQDFDSSVSAAIDAVGMGLNRSKEAAEPIKSAINQLKNAVESIKRAEALGIKLDSAIKELGLPQPRGYESSKNRLKDELKMANNSISKLEKVLSQL